MSHLKLSTRFKKVLVSLMWCTAFGRMHAQSDSPHSHLDWGAKTITLAQLRKRAKFVVYIPNRFSKKKPSLVQIVWMPDTHFTPNRYKPRQAVRIQYRIQTGASVELFEIQSVSGLDASSNHEILQSQGYFPYRMWHQKYVVGIVSIRKGSTDLSFHSPYSWSDAENVLKSSAPLNRPAR